MVGECTDVDSTPGFGRSCTASHLKVREVVLKHWLPTLLWRAKSRVSIAACFVLVYFRLYKKPEFHGLTYERTTNSRLPFLYQSNGMPCWYISGAGTSTTAPGKMMWAGVNGNTENDYLNSFLAGLQFHPRDNKSNTGLKNTVKTYKYPCRMIPFYQEDRSEKGAQFKTTGRCYDKTINIACTKHVPEVKDITCRPKSR